MEVQTGVWVTLAERNPSRRSKTCHFLAGKSPSNFILLGSMEISEVEAVPGSLAVQVSRPLAESPSHSHAPVGVSSAASKNPVAPGTSSSKRPSTLERLGGPREDEGRGFRCSGSLQWPHWPRLGTKRTGGGASVAFSRWPCWQRGFAMGCLVGWLVFAMTSCIPGKMICS